MVLVDSRNYYHWFWSVVLRRSAAGDNGTEYYGNNNCNDDSDNNDNERDRYYSGRTEPNVYKLSFEFQHSIPVDRVFFAGQL